MKSSHSLLCILWIQRRGFLCLLDRPWLSHKAGGLNRLWLLPILPRCQCMPLLQQRAGHPGTCQKCWDHCESHLPGPQALFGSFPTDFRWQICTSWYPTQHFWPFLFFCHVGVRARSEGRWRDCIGQWEPSGSRSPGNSCRRYPRGPQQGPFQLVFKVTWLVGCLALCSGAMEDPGSSESPQSCGGSLLLSKYVGQACLLALAAVPLVSTQSSTECHLVLNNNCEPSLGGV